MLTTICSHHKNRGEIVKEFNLSPYYYNTFEKDTFVFSGHEVRLVCERWQKTGDFYYLELENGDQLITTFTYRIK